MDWKARANKLKMDIPAVFLAMKRKETPWTAKLLAGLTIAYALSPIDLIPDFIPVLGYLDDILILPLLVTLAVRLMPADVLQACREEAEGLWAGGKPKRWYYASPIIVLWLLLVYFIVRSIWF